MNNKRKNIIFIIGVAIVLLIVGLVLFFVIGNKNAKEEKKEEPEKPKNYFVSGIFTNGNVEIKLIMNETSATIKYFNDGVGSDYSFIMFENNLVDNPNEPTITIKSEKEKTIEVISTNEKVLSGIYNKTKEYGIEDVLKDRFGDITYLTSELSGKYKNDKETLYILQTGEKTLVIKVDDNPFTMGLDMKENGLYVNNFSGLEVNIVKDGDNLTLSSQNEIYSGSFKKEKSFTYEDVFDIFVDM